MYSHLLILTAIFSTSCLTLHSREELARKNVENGIYYKNDLGFTWGVLLDQRMSNLHYKGPGGIINLGRRAHKPYYIAEWNFARLQFNYSRPEHKNTIVENPGAGIRYLHLRKIYSPDHYDMYLGAQANIFGNARIARRLGNSFLYADMIGELRPQGKFFFTKHFLWRQWNLEFSMAATLAGYTIRIPEYGVSYQLAEDGSSKIWGFESRFLWPNNYNHLTNGIFIRESFGGNSNPNWFRIGYIWDYYSMNGLHNLNVHNAVHQFVLELYFRTK